MLCVCVFEPVSLFSADAELFSLEATSGLKRTQQKPRIPCHLLGPSLISATATLESLG